MSDCRIHWAFAQRFPSNCLDYARLRLQTVPPERLGYSRHGFTLDERKPRGMKSALSFETTRSNVLSSFSQFLL